jgi:DHA2 family multidrug resistance protein
MASVVGFTIASVLCGVAGSLPEMVIFRSAQVCSVRRWCRCRRLCCSTPIRARSRAPRWRCGAWRDGRADLGPTLGGWLTENYDWRYVFYINVPFGLLTLLGSRSS